jgi:hypothetical protein
MKDKVNRIIHDNAVDDSFYDGFINIWQDHIDELNVDKTYPDSHVGQELQRLMNQARTRALAALREARIERSRRRRLKGDADRVEEEAEIGGDSSELSSLSDIGSSLDSDADNDDVDANEDMDDHVDEQSAEELTEEG